MARQKRPKKTVSILRRLARRVSVITLSGFVLLSLYANWFVRQSNGRRLSEKRETLPDFVAELLFSIGEVSADLTDSFGITGSDATCSLPKNHKSEGVFFAGIPKPKSPKAPSDISIIDKGEFTIAYSDKLRHPVWCAYKVSKEALFSIEGRPNFKKDKSFKSCPPASAYARTGYDRGHMVPNHAIASRYGIEAQKKTFLMTNIAPQTPELNRGVWREVEHRIADLFTARWGNAWVIVGAISEGKETLSGTDIDIPTAFYQIVAAESDGEVRALGLIIDQNVPWNVWPRHYLTSIDRIEEITGFDFFADLEDTAENALESITPTRLWPVRFLDAFKALKIHLNYR